MSSWGSSNAQIHIANALSSDLYVLVTPNPDWVWADFAAMVVETIVVEVATGGTATAAVVAEEMSNVELLIKGVKDLIAEIKQISAIKRLREFNKLYKLKPGYEVLSHGYEMVGRIATTMPSDTQIDGLVNQMKEFFHEKGAVIAPGRCQQVNRENFLQGWKALEPSYWAAISGCETASVTLVSESLGLFATFNTDPDHSWIATPEGVVRARYGTLWEPDAYAGSHGWQSTSSTALTPHQDIRRGMPYSSRNGLYQLALQSDGDLAVTNMVTGAVLWRAGAGGRGAVRAMLMRDARFVLRNADGTIVWVSPAGPPTDGFDPDHLVRVWDKVFDTPDEQKPRLWADGLELRDDGELVLRSHQVARNFAKGDTPSGEAFWTRDTIPGDELIVRSATRDEWRSGCREAPRSRMVPGETLMPGDFLQSPNLSHRLIFQRDGNLVLQRNDGNILWMSGTRGRGSTVRFQRSDAVLVVADVLDNIVWSSQMDGAMCGPAFVDARLEMQDDGNLVAYDRVGLAYWDTFRFRRLKLTLPRTLDQKLSALRMATPGSNHLNADECLQPGMFLRSSDGRFKLDYGRDGNLVLTRSSDDGVVWRTSIRGYPGFGGCLIVKDDGDLVLTAPTDTSETVYWSASGHGGRTGQEFGGATLVVQNDGNLVVYAPDRTLMWTANTHGELMSTTPPPPPPPPPLPAICLGAMLRGGQVMGPGQWLQSVNGIYKLRYQSDGNLVVYGTNDTVLWYSGTNGQPAWRVAVEENADLVIYSAPGTAIWRASDHFGKTVEGTGSNPFLMMQDDGNLVLRIATVSTIEAVLRTGSPLLDRWASDRALLDRVHAANQPLARVDDPRSLSLTGGGVWLPTIPSLGYAPNGDVTGYTVEGWVLFNSLQPWMRVFDLGSPQGVSNNGIYLAVFNNEGQLTLDAFTNGFQRTVTPAGTIRTGEWTHLCVTVSPSGAASIYKNGSLVAQGQVGNTRVERASNFLGRSNWQQDPPMDGAVSMFSIWQRPLDADEVRSRMSVFPDGNEPGLLGCWPFNQTAPREVAGYARGAQLGDATILGSAAWSHAGPTLGTAAQVAQWAAEQAAAEAARLAAQQAAELAARQAAELAAQQAAELAARQAAELAAQQAAQRAAELFALPFVTGVSVKGVSASSLGPNQAIYSANKWYMVVNQGDGNVVLLRRDGAILWQTRTTLEKNGGLVVRPDGSMVVNAPSRFARLFPNGLQWNSTASGGRSGAQYANSLMYIQDDGCLVVKATDGAVLWSSNTAQSGPPPSMVTATPPPPPAQCMGASLAAGQTLAPTQWLESENGNYKLLYKPEGAVVLSKRDGTALWQVDAGLAPTGRVAVHFNGTLTTYTADGTTMWTSEQHGGQVRTSRTPCTLTLKNDGNLVLAPSSGDPLWMSNTAQGGLGSYIETNAYLEPAQWLESDSGAYKLVYQRDGNVVLTGSDGAVRWQTGTSGTGAWRFLLQSDGNLVVLDPGNNPHWSSGASGGLVNPDYSGMRLTLRDDGTLVLGVDGGPTFWTSTTTLAPATSLGSSLGVGRPLSVGQWIQSSNGRFKLALRNDGIFALSNAGGFPILWNPGEIGAQAVLQDDGDLTIRDAAGNVRWSTSGNGGQTGSQFEGSSLLLLDDGTIAVRAPDGTDLWFDGPHE